MFFSDLQKLCTRKIENSFRNNNIREKFLLCYIVFISLLLTSMQEKHVNLTSQISNSIVIFHIITFHKGTERRYYSEVAV